jgi:hypothetical protein
MDSFKLIALRVGRLVFADINMAVIIIIEVLTIEVSYIVCPCHARLVGWVGTDRIPGAAERRPDVAEADPAKASKVSFILKKEKGRITILT